MACAKHRLITNEERYRRGIGGNPACGLCGHESEIILHVLRDCTIARDIWNQVIPTGMSFFFFCRDFT